MRTLYFGPIPNLKGDYFQPSLSESVGPYLLWPNGCMDRDATWYGGRPRPRRLCVRCGPRSPPPEGGGAPKFSAHVHCGQKAVWIKMALGMDLLKSMPQHRRLCVRWGPSPLNFRPMFIIVIVISLEHCTVVICLFKFKF